MTVGGTEFGTLLHEDDEDTANVLLLAPSLSTAEEEACINFLTFLGISQENILSVTFTQTAQDRLELWQTHVGDERPARAGIVSVGEQTRSASSQRTTSRQPPESISIDAISDPADLTRLGITIENYLSEWAENENQTVICFHSLTPLLQYADRERVFRFLHLLTGRIDSIDAVAHFHMNPEAHDAQTRNTLVQLFDAVIDIDETGERTIKQ